jgi:hypothetical protein
MAVFYLIGDLKVQGVSSFWHSVEKGTEKGSEGLFFNHGIKLIIIHSRHAL